MSLQRRDSHPNAQNQRAGGRTTLAGTFLTVRVGIAESSASTMLAETSPTHAMSLVRQSWIWGMSGWCPNVQPMRSTLGGVQFRRCCVRRQTTLQT